MAKARKVEHHAFVPWQEVPAFVAELKAMDNAKGMAIEFLILTAARTGEVVKGERSPGMNWSEVDFATATWTVPEDRMKKFREHRVPLSERAVAILRTMADQRTDDRVFPIGYDSLKMTMRKMRPVGDLHGFRQSFGNWCRDHGENEALGDLSLSHNKDDGTKASYFTSDALERRRAIMDRWSAYCEGGEPSAHAAAA